MAKDFIDTNDFTAPELPGCWSSAITDIAERVERASPVI